MRCINVCTLKTYKILVVRHVVFTNMGSELFGEKRFEDKTRKIPVKNDFKSFSPNWKLWNTILKRFSPEILWKSFSISFSQIVTFRNFLLMLLMVHFEELRGKTGADRKVSASSFDWWYFWIIWVSKQIKNGWCEIP